MSLRENFQKFLSGKLLKADLIRENYESTFKILFEISDYLKETEIKSIELANGEVVMTFHSGMKLACEKNEYRTAPIEALNFLKYEESEVFIFTQLLKDKKCFFDIGGNIGFYAVYAAVINPQIKVKAFEPVHKMYHALQTNITLNNLADRVEAHNLGFSDHDGTVSFFVYPFGGTNSSMVNVSDNKDAKEVKAKIMKLDDFVKSSSLPDIIKCDVEGAEKLVIDGGLKTLMKAKPVLFIELLRKWSTKFNYHPNDVLKILSSLGYNCYTPSGGKLVYFGMMDENTTETNFFFLHPKVHQKHIKDLVIA